MSRKHLLESLTLGQCKSVLKMELMDVLEVTLSQGVKAEGYLLGATDLSVIRALPIYDKMLTLRDRGLSYIDSIKSKKEAIEAFRKIRNQAM